MKKQLIEFYLEFYNALLSVETFAEQHEISVNECKELLRMGVKYKYKK